MIRGNKRKNIDSFDVEVPTESRTFTPEAVHGAIDMNDPQVKMFGCCCGTVLLGAFIGLIVLLCSIHTLGPEEQVVIEGADGKYVLNGPRTSVLSPSRKKTFRDASRLGPRQYAVIKNTRTGKIRHEAGPKLLWLEAYDENVGNREKIVLQLQQYIRLIDKATGSERVVVGPEILIPEVLEQSPNGTQDAIVLSTGMTVLTRTHGKVEIHDQEGVYTPKPYEHIVEVRHATVLGAKDYAVVNNTKTGVLRHVEGPLLLKLGPRDILLTVKKKIVLEKDQYCRLKNSTGTERVVSGPQTFVPLPAESAPEGVQRAVYLDTDTAVIVLNRVTGQLRLVTEKGVFMPGAYEKINATRELIRVLPQEAVVVRDANGTLHIHNGAKGVSAFFLPPYTEVVIFRWSDYSRPPEPGVAQIGAETPRDRIDLRTQKVFFRNEVRTQDNVKLQLEGTVFWKVVNVSRILFAEDPEGDVWIHSRSALIQAVSKHTLNGFMAAFNNISQEAYESQAHDGFYTMRGIELQSMELTRFDCVDESTNVILQEIIMETTQRINRLQVQESENEVKAAALQAEITLERQRTELIRTKALNERLQAEMEGDVDGTQLMRSAATFIGGLNESVPDVEKRVALYEMHERLKGKNKDTLNLASGHAKLFLTAEDVNLKMAS